MARTIATDAGDGQLTTGTGRHATVRPMRGSRATADLARSAWLMAYARGLAASPAWSDDAPDELLHAAEHDADLLRATRGRMPDGEAAQDLITEALRRLENASSGADLDATEDLLLANAELFENPGDYAAGVRDAFEALRPLLRSRCCSPRTRLVDLTDAGLVDHPGDGSSQ